MIREWNRSVTAAQTHTHVRICTYLIMRNKHEGRRCAARNATLAHAVREACANIALLHTHTHTLIIARIPLCVCVFSSVSAFHQRKSIPHIRACALINNVKDYSCFALDWRRASQRVFSTRSSTSSHTHTQGV